MRRRWNREMRRYGLLVIEAVEAGAVRPDEWYFQCANGDFIGAWGPVASAIWDCLEPSWQKRQNVDAVGLTYADVRRAVEVQGVWESSRERERRKLYKAVGF